MDLEKLVTNVEESGIMQENVRQKGKVKVKLLKAKETLATPKVG